jgi:hypothetical protein
MQIACRKADVNLLPGQDFTCVTQDETLRKPTRDTVTAIED